MSPYIDTYNETDYQRAERLSLAVSALKEQVAELTRRNELLVAALRQTVSDADELSRLQAQSEESHPIQKY